VEGVSVFGVRSQVQLKAIITQTAYMLGTETPEFKERGTSAQDGAVKGLRKAAASGAKSLVHKVAYSLVSGSSGGVPGRTVKVLVTGIGFSGARALKAGLEETKGITAVYQRAFANRKLELDVNTEGNAEDLAVALESLGLEISALTANTIEATAKE